MSKIVFSLPKCIDSSTAQFYVRGFLPHETVSNEDIGKILVNNQEATATVILNGDMDPRVITAVLIEYFRFAQSVSQVPDVYLMCHLFDQIYTNRMAHIPFFKQITICVHETSLVKHDTPITDERPEYITDEIVSACNSRDILRKLNKGIDTDCIGKRYSGPMNQTPKGLSAGDIDARDLHYLFSVFPREAEQMIHEMLKIANAGV